MADDLILEIVTPEKMVFSEKVEEVTLPGTEGEFGVLRGHASLLSSIEIGEMNMTREGKKSFYALNTGYVEVTSGKVTVLVESAERSDMIDKDRAQRAKDLAENNLARIAKEDADFEVMRAALLRAITRLKVAERS
ncbi:MAG: F0F1 ATP synthase subunit epsilon [Syntrophales bacterium]|jgi:F-type H+-transporting ATPase subunit epsilon|nr:F0F1 ATP synthase subunit epsilon [Syntrophales bacterium]HOG08000.1 F0F1 ATP synthase subunit epsilon [Syntrophales bacterium]HPB70562.1 F0F1 ATP synthase subunit epsilon [Syntrophales bacterium]HQN26028.1 F0F1 ATP synthase subunit epsilon [Syntrophales bacterium]HQP29495.1 F0F1 ATP synthase subunit epsilon [Syntrophales bacterium]